MKKSVKNATIKRQVRIEKKAKQFEKNNPEIAKSLKLFDMTIREYDRVIQSINPVKTYTSNSTLASTD